MYTQGYQLEGGWGCCFRAILTHIDHNHRSHVIYLWITYCSLNPERQENEKWWRRQKQKDGKMTYAAMSEVVRCINFCFLRVNSVLIYLLFASEIMQHYSRRRTLTYSFLPRKLYVFHMAFQKVLLELSIRPAPLTPSAKWGKKNPKTLNKQRITQLQYYPHENFFSCYSTKSLCTLLSVSQRLL